MAIGWTISDGKTSISSENLNRNGIHCIGEENIDDKSFSNEYVYNEDIKGYFVVQSKPNLSSFTMSFVITSNTNQVISQVNQLRSFFDKPGTTFTITRNVNGLTNSFVVDSLSTSHYTEEGEWVPFEFTGSFIGLLTDQPIFREEVIFTGEDPNFTFDHYFEQPEPSTMFGESVNNSTPKVIDNNLSDSQGITITANVLSNGSIITYQNLTYDELFTISYDFIPGDSILINTESDDLEFTLNRAGILSDLLPFVDFSVSSLPILYFGENTIRFDTYYEDPTDGLIPIYGWGIILSHMKKEG